MLALQPQFEPQVANARHREHLDLAFAVEVGAPMRDALRRALQRLAGKGCGGIEARRLRGERNLGTVDLLEVGLLPVRDAVLAHRHERRQLDLPV